MSATVRPVAGYDGPFTFIYGSTDIDLTTVSAPIVIAHRFDETGAEVDYAGAPTTTPETWTCVITGTPTANELRATYTAPSTGAGSWVAGQTLTCRLAVTVGGIVRPWQNTIAIGPVQVR